MNFTTYTIYLPLTRLIGSKKIYIVFHKLIQCVKGINIFIV